MEKTFEQFNKREIDRDEDKESFREEEKPKQKEEFSEELKEYQKEGQEMIDSYRKFFMTFAKDVSLDFKMSDGFYINLENGEVNLDTKWFAEKGFSKEQILWATLDQLSKFEDFANDHEGLKKRLNHENNFGANKRPYKLLRENIDQIYRKNLIERKAPRYERDTTGGKEVRALYKNKLSPDQDLTSLPHHLQFINALTREEFVPDEEIFLSDEVKTALENKIKFQGKKYTPKEIISQFIKPRSSRDTKASQRYFVLEHTLQNTFRDLLEKDLENESKGRDLAEEIDSDLPPQEQDEYFPQDMESREGNEKEPHIFRITPGHIGYYKGGIRNSFDKNTLRWRKKKQTEPYAKSVQTKQYMYQGKIHGFVSIPLPDGQAIDIDSLNTSSGQIEIVRDQFGAFYARSDVLQEFSFQFGPQQFLESSNHDDFLEFIFNTKLSRETEAILQKLANLASDEDKANKLAEYIKSNKSYNIQAQGQLYNNSKNADDYFKKIDNAKEVECYTANTFFVGLCRRLGIPARLATGHFISKKNKEGASDITRNTGHAWSEIWNGYEWVLKDATPPGSGEGYGEDYDNAEGNNPDQINPEDIEDWMEKKEEDKKEKEEQEAKEKEEESKSAEEKAGEAQEKMDKSWREKHNISQETLQQYRKIEAEVAPYLEDLSKLWQRIIFGSTKKIERGMEGHFKDGTELDIQKTIEQWPQIQKGELEETRIFKKMTRKEILIRRPELIRLRLVGDMSGSMDEKKKHILQQSFVLLLSSFREFNTYLNLTRSQTKSKLEADTEAWVFGTRSEKVKRFRSESNMDDELIETIKIFEKLKNTKGYTCDFKVFEKISDSLTQKDKEKIGQEKIMEIVFEITDGGSTVVNKEGTENEEAEFVSEKTKQAVDNLLSQGVIIRGFQIGETDIDEKRVFNEVWNKNREEKLGEIVGEKIENLLPAITELLKKYMSNVRL